MAATEADEILRNILERRGVKGDKQQQNFLYPDYPATLHDPLLLPDMEPAVERIVQAISDGDRILVYGDYDIDGLAATTLLVSTLEGIGADVTAFIPDRFEDGYGLNQATLQAVLEAHAPRLIITVDTGSTAVAEIDWLNQAGIDVIVTDHHEVLKQLPNALAVINPKRKDSHYPFRGLAGTGVAFKLVQGLQQRTKLITPGQEKWLLDLVALGTVCDVVPLVDENRTLVYWGLKVLAKTRRAGLRALADITDQDLSQVSASTLGFIFGPRLNAAGRLENADLSLKLLLSNDIKSCLAMAVKLNRLNTARRDQQTKVEAEANKVIEQMSNHAVIVVGHKDWPQGVIGIVASKLMEKYRKPVFIMQFLDGQAKGSARSFGDYNLADAIKYCRPLLISGGGHSAAAGFTVALENVDDLRRKLNQHYRAQKLTNQDRYLEPEIEQRFTKFSSLTADLAAKLELLAPFGPGNWEPNFELSTLTIRQVKPVGREAKHLKLRVEDVHGHELEAISFNEQNIYRVGDRISVIAKLRLNNYSGRSRPELVVERITTKVNLHNPPLL